MLRKVFALLALVGTLILIAGLINLLCLISEIPELQSVFMLLTAEQRASILFTVYAACFLNLIVGALVLLSPTCPAIASSSRVTEDPEFAMVDIPSQVASSKDPEPIAPVLVPEVFPLVRDDPTSAPLSPSAPTPPAAFTHPKESQASLSAAYHILYLFQKEGRLIDVLMEDISSLDNETLGGAIRPIHEGCRKLLVDRLVVAPVLDYPENEEITLETFDPEAVKLTGNVPATGPYRGTLIHRGWRLTQCRLPELTDGWKNDVIVPAELEIE